jgi:hypothetical protein
VSIEVPREPTLGRSSRPPVQVSLPIEVNPRVGLFAILLVFLLGLIGGPLVLGGGGLAILGAPTFWPFPSVSGVIMTVVGLAMAGFGWCLFAGAATVIADQLRRRPAITIDTEAIRDSRLAPQPIPWASVARASVVYRDPYSRQDPVAINLTMRTTVAAHHNPFRPGALMLRWGRRSNELHVPLYFLNQKRHVLAHVITALVQQHGGIIERADQIGGSLKRLLAFLVAGFLAALVVSVLIYLSPAIILALLAAIAACALLAPMASRHGWFSEGRLNARLNRPRFEDETHRTTMK